MSQKKNPLTTLLGVSFELVAVVVAAVFLGPWLDQKFGWDGWGLPGLIVLGFAGWVFRIIVVLKALEPPEGPDDKP